LEDHSRTGLLCLYRTGWLLLPRQSRRYSSNLEHLRL